jgi:microcystin degradation protein MlrC
VASRAWKNRSLFNLGAVELEDAVKIAINHKYFPVILNDIGDNTGGGSSADSTFILHEMIKQNAKNYCTVFFDSESVGQCVSAGIGARLSLKIGGKVDDQHGDPVEIEGIVTNISDGKWTDSEIRHGGYTKYNQGDTVLFETENKGSIILTTLRMSPMSIGQLTHIGVEPKNKKIITARGVILPRPAYDPIAAKTILVNTKGSTTADLKNLNFGNISRDLYPLQDSKFKLGLNEV